MKTELSLTACLALTLAIACQPSSTRESTIAPTNTSEDVGTTPQADPTILGGQRYDKWFKVEGYAGGFSPDKKDTEVVDGAAGPRGDGTLNNGNGEPLPNTGHDYRLKNLFGWDLRGAEGIYGPTYQNKSYVSPLNLLSDDRPRAELLEWFTAGDEMLPAYGDVMTASEIESLVDFILAVREGALPRPEQIFALSAEAPKNYTLMPGADPKAGTELFGQRCSGCHGDAGEAIVIDGIYTVGAFGRAKAYEGWLKVLSGHPGSPMSRQSSDAQEILNLFAALCDRAAFPPLSDEHEVADGDLRCGAYLK